MKKNNKTTEVVSEMVEEIEMNNSFSDIADRKFLSSTPKKQKDDIIEDPINNELLTCSSANISVKKTSLKKHIMTKHTKHQCKDCNEKLPTFI